MKVRTTHLQLLILQRRAQVGVRGSQVRPQPTRNEMRDLPSKPVFVFMASPFF